ncbi:MAG TPA: GspH/FimT family pseudopilin [Woeseiaceae bacterium]|nr:GspH/FimT family pseudopilin [Woeseiaceae bacterium]
MKRFLIKNSVRPGDLPRHALAVGRPRTSQRGLTMLELLTAMVVLGILTAIAIPSFEQITTTNRLAADTNELVASFQHARSTAITRGENVTVCAADAALAACSGGANWAAGWVVLDATANVLQVHEPLPVNSANEIGAANGIGAVVFNRNGFSTNARTIKLCGPKNVAKRARGVVISPDGRVRLASDTNGNGVVEDRTGADVGCP